MLQFEYPWAFLLLLPLILLHRWPRRQVRAYLAVNMPANTRTQLPITAQPRWINRLPSYCLSGFLVVLILLISDPYVGTQETYEVAESRSIFVLLDTSASMIQTGLLKRVITGFLVHFIDARPDGDRLAVARFDADASGGIFTKNHQGLLMEITRPSMVQQFDLSQIGSKLSEKGTQMGVGLFKTLKSFIEDEVETRIAEQQLSLAKQLAIYQDLQDVLRQFLWHLLQKEKGVFALDIPLVPDLKVLGHGKALLVITDGQLLKTTSRATLINYLHVLDYYQRLGFRHLHFVSLKTHPAQLNGLLRQNPLWKAHTWDQTQAGLQQIFDEVAKDTDAMETGRGLVATQIIKQRIFQWFLPALLLLLMAMGLRLHKKLRVVP
ncbi:MAG: hypothetical protein ETSY1_38390 [Candidatus Entotheonella factor]|uniref:VWFA domain-containing protein n=1 Tax=Entotheonella factor TaxID=1429438 RepID=W4L7G3_ENTF1|nr:hypothetical protein [Candidatus Entotheonella palauensis]ETW93625.1 MAG: hypothetical protein ETSY1_38390 [Candidatus Entotheonella factor]